MNNIFVQVAKDLMSKLSVNNLKQEDWVNMRSKLELTIKPTDDPWDNPAFSTYIKAWIALAELTILKISEGEALKSKVTIKETALTQEKEVNDNLKLTVAASQEQVEKLSEKLATVQKQLTSSPLLALGGSEEPSTRVLSSIVISAVASKANGTTLNGVMQHLLTVTGIEYDKGIITSILKFYKDSGLLELKGRTYHLAEPHVYKSGVRCAPSLGDRLRAILDS